VRLDIPDRPRPYVMAHRGNSAHCPENTLAAFRRAIDEGTDLIETDLHVTSDGHFVCIHDPKVDRTTDGSGAVRDMALSEIRKLRASCGRAEFSGECVPTLKELFDTVPENMAIALELKTDDFLEPATGQKLVKEIEAASRRELTVLLSFVSGRVQAVRQQARDAGFDIPSGSITYRRPWPEDGFELQGPVWPLLLLNPFYVWWAHRKGMLVCPLDLAPDRRLWYYRLLGCDAVLTNDPGKTLRALSRAERS